MKPESINSSPKWYHFCLFLFVWLSVCISIFIIMLQPLGGVISQKYAALSGAIGLILTLPIFFLMWKRPDIIARPSRDSIIGIIFQTAFFCGLLWLFLPLPNNLLLAPIVKVDLSFQGTKSGFVEIIWLRSGLGDIPYKTLDLSLDDQISSESVRINFDPNGEANLSWSGRAWKQVSFVIKTVDPVQVTAQIDDGSRVFDLDSKINLENEIVLPVKSQSYFLTINLLLLPFFFVAVGYFLFLFLLFFRSLLNLARLFPERVINISQKSLEKWFRILTTLIYGIAAIAIITIGIFNRLYMDDFCRLNIFRLHGYLGAILYGYQEINGRFASHVFNFLAFSFGKTTIPMGPLIAFLGIGASQYFLFTQLVEPQFIKGGAGTSRSRFFGILISIIIIVTASLMAPLLYESIIWTLHSIIITGSLVLMNIFIGLVLFFSSEPSKRFGQTTLFLIFSLLGFCVMGFSEAASLAIIGIYCLVVLVFLVTKQIRNHWGLLTGYIFGIVIGILLAANAPASTNRLNNLGSSLNPLEILANLLNLIQLSFHTIFLGGSITGLAAFLVALLVGYTIGRVLPNPLRHEQKLPRSAVGNFVLFLVPVLITFITLLPSAVVNNYLPKRTLFIPIYLLVTQYFLLTLYFGRRDAGKVNSTRILIIITSFAVLVTGILGLSSIVKMTKQILVFASEFDARETEIYTAKASGFHQIDLTPYNNEISMDIPPDPANWYHACLNEYYGIDLVIDRSK
jgi:hypothetical protein